MANKSVEQKYAELCPHFGKWEKIKDMVDQNIDLMVNFSQSGHPGGSALQGAGVHRPTALRRLPMDIRHPEKAFGDRFILSAGHSIPLIYATFAVLTQPSASSTKRPGTPGTSSSRARPCGRRISPSRRTFRSR